MMLIRDQDGVRMISRGGHDWADRFEKLPEESFVIEDARLPRAAAWAA
jgi:ATP-dependent DNA ligase